VHVSYPGMGGYPSTYDGTLRPKYTLASDKPEGTTGIIWGDLRADRRGKGLIMAAATRIHDADGKLAAVTGMEMQFDFLAKQLLPMDGAPPYVDAVYLVQPDGKVVIGTDAMFSEVDAKAHRANAGETSDDAVELDALPYPEVHAAIKGGQRGHVIIEIGGDRKLVAFTPLAAMGWTYVVIADEEQLMAAERI